jgi:hypothetical protein
LGDFIEDKSVVSPAEAVINMNLAEQTRKVLKTLTPREEKVLRMRFGIGEKSDHTLEEVGQDFEVTRERIRQIEAKALRKLRHPSRSNSSRASSRLSDELRAEDLPVQICCSLSLLVPLGACDRGARAAKGGRGVGGLAPGMSLSMNAVDCLTAWRVARKGVVFAASGDHSAAVPGPLGVLVPLGAAGGCRPLWPMGWRSSSIRLARRRLLRTAPRYPAVRGSLGSAVAGAVCDEGPGIRAPMGWSSVPVGIAVGRCERVLRSGRVN